MSKIIALDIGGTYIKWALVDENDDFVDSGKIPTEAFESNAAGIIEKAAKLAQTFVDKGEDIKGVGISMLGIFDRERKIPLTEITNLPNSKDLDIKNEFNKHCKLPFEIINDTNAAALGEQSKGMLKGVKNGVLMTIGTGIGGAIIINDEIYEGFNFAAGEFGRHYLLESQRFESLGSTRSLVNKIALITGKDNLNGESLEDIIKINSDARDTYNEWIETLSYGIANVISILSPEVFVVGGGISQSKILDIDLISEKVEKLLKYNFEKKTKICKTELGNDVALYGAASLIR